MLSSKLLAAQQNKNVCDIFMTFNMILISHIIRSHKTDTYALAKMPTLLQSIMKLMNLVIWLCTYVKYKVFSSWCLKILIV